jgi:hypothetical protein
MTNSEMKNPVECRSAGVLGRWSNLATPPVRHIGCRIFEQKGTKETKREFRFEMGTSLSLFASVQNPSPNQAKSSQIKPNRAILCLDAMQSQPPVWSKIATPPVLRPIRRPVRRSLGEGGSEAKAGLPRRSTAKAGQTPSKPVKVFFQSLSPSQGSTCQHHILWFPGPNAKPIVVCCYSIPNCSHAIRNFSQTPSHLVQPSSRLDHEYGPQNCEISQLRWCHAHPRHPKTPSLHHSASPPAIPLGSTYFLPVPLNSTSRPLGISHAPNPRSSKNMKRGVF